MLESFAGKFVQDAYVTSDFDAALAQVGSLFGIRRWFQLRDLALDIGGGRICHQHVALAMLGAVQIEVIAPIGGDDTVYRQVLAEDAGLQIVPHHAALLIDSLDEMAAIRAHAQERQIPVPIDGSAAGGTHFLYIDVRSSIGRHLEFIYYPPGRWDILTARIRDA